MNPRSSSKVSPRYFNTEPADKLVEIREMEEEGDDFMEKNIISRDTIVKHWVNDDPYHAKIAFRSKIFSRIIKMLILVIFSVVPVFFIFIYPLLFRSSFSEEYV